MSELFGNETLFILVLIVAALQFKRIGTFLNLSKIRLRTSCWRPLAPSEVPEYTAHLLECAGKGLQQLGFELLHTEAAEPINAFDPRSRMFAALYRHPSEPVLARAELAEALSGQLTKVSFLTLYDDGTALLTVNREQWSQLPAPEQIRVQDAYADDLAGQWRFHQTAMAEQAGQRTALHDTEAMLPRQLELGFECWLARMRQLGWIRPEPGGDYRFSPQGAWRYAGQLTRLHAKVRAALAQPYRHDPPPDPGSARMAEVDAFAAHLALAAQPLPAWIKALLFTLTLILSALFFGRGFGLLDAAALLIVLLVHELGHLAAMLAFDYRNLSIFFLPFLGAAATGHKPHAPAWQEAMVLLAGPVLGLVLALIATQLPADALPLPAIQFVRAFVWFGLVLNLFNLLPIGILDGGRLFALALLGRFPYGQALFAALGVALGGLYAFWSRSPIFGIAMLLLLFALPLQFKAARLIAAIRAKAKVRAIPAMDRQQALQALGREFAEGSYGGTDAKGWMQRLNIARMAYPRLLQGAPGWGVSIAVFFAHGLVLLLPVALLLWSLQQPGHTPLMRTTEAEHIESARQLAQQHKTPEAQEARNRFLARYRAQSDAAARWDLLDQLEEQPEEEAAWLFEQQHQQWMQAQRDLLLEQLPAGHAGKLRYRLAQIDASAAGAAEELFAIISQLTGEGMRNAAELDEQRFAILRDAYGQLARQAPPALMAEAAGAIETLWSALNAPDHPLAVHRGALAAIRGRMAFAAGQIDTAATWMQRYRDGAEAADRQAGLSYAWFLLDIGRHDQALELARHAIETAAAELPDTARLPWQTLAGWAEMGRGQPRLALANFQAVLDSRNARLQHYRDQMPWWLRWISWGENANFDPWRWIDAQTLDRLAALEGCDPPQAKQMLAELVKSAAEERQRQRAAMIVSTFDGWGQARAATHERLLNALGLPRTNAAPPRG